MVTNGEKKDQFQEWNTYQITTDDNTDVIVDYKTNKIKTKYFVFFLIWSYKSKQIFY
jgi:hypothetical protein